MCGGSGWADVSCDFGAVEFGATPSTGLVFSNGFE
jgi:hypothetical protein